MTGPFEAHFGETRPGARIAWGGAPDGGYQIDYERGVVLSPRAIAPTLGDMSMAEEGKRSDAVPGRAGEPARDTLPRRPQTEEIAAPQMTAVRFGHRRNPGPDAAMARRTRPRPRAPLGASGAPSTCSTSRSPTPRCGRYSASASMPASQHPWRSSRAEPRAATAWQPRTFPNSSRRWRSTASPANCCMPSGTATPSPNASGRSRENRGAHRRPAHPTPVRPQLGSADAGATAGDPPASRRPAPAAGQVRAPDQPARPWRPALRTRHRRLVLLAPSGSSAIPTATGVSRLERFGTPIAVAKTRRNAPPGGGRRSPAHAFGHRRRHLSSTCPRASRSRSSKAAADRAAISTCFPATWTA